MNRYVFVFPGIGYNEDRPLLYYSRKIAEKHGYHYIRLPQYDPVFKDIRSDLEIRRMMISSESENLENAIRILDLRPDDELLIISKSIGAAIASSYLKKCPHKFKAIYFTPIPEMFEDILPSSGIVFHGTNDPWADNELIEKGCRDNSLPLYITEGANHSLETGNIDNDLCELHQVMAICERHIKNDSASFGSTTRNNQTGFHMIRPIC